MFDTLIGWMIVIVISNTLNFVILTIIQKKLMQENSKDYEFCIKVALENAKKRINLLDNSDKKCVLEEYKEWLKDWLGSHTILLLREDPII